MSQSRRFWKTWVPLSRYAILMNIICKICRVKCYYKYSKKYKTNSIHNIKACIIVILAYSMLLQLVHVFIIVVFLYMFYIIACVYNLLITSNKETYFQSFIILRKSRNVFLIYVEDDACIISDACSWWCMHVSSATCITDATCMHHQLHASLMIHACIISDAYSRLR